MRNGTGLKYGTAKLRMRMKGADFGGKVRSTACEVGMMSKSVVFRVSATPLAVSEVVQLLKNPPEEAISTLPPAKPKAGEIYIYKNDDSANGNLVMHGVGKVLLLRKAFIIPCV